MATLVTKTQQVKDLVKSGNFKKAFQIAKNFKREFNEDQRSSIAIAYECMTGKESFYKQLGTDVENHTNIATKLLLNY